VRAAVVRQHAKFKQATDTSIDAVMKAWLQTAGDRDGGRLKRYRRSASDLDT